MEATPLLKKKGRKEDDYQENDDRVVEVDGDDGEALLVGPGGAAKERQGAYVGGDDGNADRPPGRGAAAEIKILGACDPLAQSISEPEVPQKIGDQDRPV